MSEQSFHSIMQSLKKGNYAPLYVLHGEELFFIDQIANYIARNALEESERAFNQVTWYGKDVSAKEVADEARQYPMMANRRVVIVKEAQGMRDLNDLEHYALQPAQTSVLVIAHPYKKVDGRTRFLKEAKKNGVVFEAKKLYDNQLPEWVSTYVSEHGAAIEPDALDTIIEFVGNDLARMGHALDGLILNAKDGDAISRSQVMDSISVSREYNVFELQKALGMRDAAAVERIVRFFVADIKSHPMQVILGTLFSFYSKLLVVKSLNSNNMNEIAAAIGIRSQYFARDYAAAAQKLTTRELAEIMDILHRYDLVSKGVGSRNRDDASLLRQMVQEILLVRQLIAN